MGFWGDNVYRYDEIEVRDQSDRAWDLSFIVPTSVTPSSDINIFILSRNNDLLVDIDDLSCYPNALMGNSYFKIYMNADRTPQVTISLSDSEFTHVSSGIYQYVWSVPTFDKDAFSLELTLETEYINPLTYHYPEEQILINKTFTFCLGGKSAGGGGTTPVGTETIRLNVQDRTTHDPIDGANFYVLDELGTNLLYFGKTNGSGLAVLFGNIEPDLTVDPGDYRVRLTRSLALFEPNYAITVETSGVSEFILEGTILAIPQPINPDLCCVYGNLTDFKLVPKQDVTVIIYGYNAPDTVSDIIITTHPQTILTDELGAFHFDAAQGAFIRVVIEYSEIDQTITVPYSSLCNLKDLLTTE